MTSLRQPLEGAARILLDNGSTYLGEACLAGGIVTFAGQQVAPGTDRPLGRPVRRSVPLSRIDRVDWLDDDEAVAA